MSPELSKATLKPWSVVDLGAQDAEKYAWRVIRSFCNEKFVSRMICERFSLSNRQRHNAEKQARQLRYCILQAEQYFESSRAATAAIRPLLLYYGIMSMALAEILWKQDGLSSLDAVRGIHSHHGLDFTLRPVGTGEFGQLEGLSVRRFEVGGKARGTFELWRRSADHHPLVGTISTDIGEGRRQSGSQIIVDSDNLGLLEFPSGGLSYLDVVRHIPTLFRFTNAIRVRSALVRARLARIGVHHQQARYTFQVTVQPSAREAIERVAHGFLVRPSDYERFSHVEFPTGFVVTWDCRDEEEIHITCPNGFNISDDEVFLIDPTFPLNEFGTFYCALFALGMYCRYYPEMWMASIDDREELYTVSDMVMSSALTRVPLLLASELNRELYV